jgi:hypothetical protein
MAAPDRERSPVDRPGCRRIVSRCSLSTSYSSLVGGGPGGKEACSPLRHASSVPQPARRAIHRAATALDRGCMRVLTRGGARRHRHPGGGTHRGGPAAGRDDRPDARVASRDPRRHLCGAGGGAAARRHRVARGDGTVVECVPARRHARLRRLRRCHRHARRGRTANAGWRRLHAPMGGPSSARGTG